MSKRLQRQTSRALNPLHSGLYREVAGTPLDCVVPLLNALSVRRSGECLQGTQRQSSANPGQLGACGGVRLCPQYRRQRDLVIGVAGPDLSRVWMVTGMRSARPSGLFVASILPWAVFHTMAAAYTRMPGR